MRGLDDFERPMLEFAARCRGRHDAGPPAPAAICTPDGDFAPAFEAAAHRLEARGLVRGAPCAACSEATDCDALHPDATALGLDLLAIDRALRAGGAP